VRELVDPHRLARVQARVIGYGKHQSLMWSAPNVAAAELDLSAMPLDTGAPLLVHAGLTVHQMPAPLPERVFLVQRGGAWGLETAWSTQPRVGRPYRPGAAADLYTGDPLLVVYGTRGSEARAAVLREAAERAALFRGSGGPDGGMRVGGVPIKPDVDVTSEDLARFNLILLGSARDNALVGRMAGNLPVAVNGNNELIAGTREPVSLKGAGIRLAYYNPLAPDRLVFLVATDEAGELADDWLKRAAWHLTGAVGIHRVSQPDLVVQSLDGRDRRRMQFTHGWQWREVPGQTVRLPPDKAEKELLTLARLRVMRRAAGADFAVGLPGEDDEDRLDPDWFTLADAFTDTRERPMLVVRMTGEELATVIKEDWALAPPVEPEAIASTRTYRVCTSLLFSGMLSRYHLAFPELELGPEWRPADRWRELFGE
jgi:hypothetical protein